MQAFVVSNRRLVHVRVLARRFMTLHALGMKLEREHR